MTYRPTTSIRCHVTVHIERSTWPVCRKDCINSILCVTSTQHFITIFERVPRTSHTVTRISIIAITLPDIILTYTACSTCAAFVVGVAAQLTAITSTDLCAIGIDVSFAILM